MTSKKNYSRCFIILQEDEKNFGISTGKTPTGYAKLEIKNAKCKISYYVQNLKLNEKYYMFVICGKNNIRKLMNIGEMKLDEQGRFDESYEYDIDNIAGTSIEYDKIVGASVVKINNDKIMPIMSGFTTSNVPDEWRNYEIIDTQTIDEKENIFDEYEKSIEQSKTSFKNPRQQSQEENDDTEKTNQEGLNIQVEKTTENQKDKINQDECTRSLKSNSCVQFFDMVAQGYEELFDVCDYIKNCKWYKIDIKDYNSICDMSDYDKYVVVYYPMISYYPYIKRYQHYLMGYKYNKDGNIKYIIYAVPGDKSEKCQPYGGKTGFVTWIKNKKKDNSGYWLMFYDYKTSKVLIPVKKKK